MFRALLAHPRETLHKRHLVYCVRVTSVGCTSSSPVLMQPTDITRTQYTKCCLCIGGPGSSVGIAIGYGLDGPGIESRFGARFSAPVQTGPGAHPASCTMSTGSLPGVESGRGVTLIPNPLRVPRSKTEYSYTSSLPKGLRGL
jgi:hypothetical protein